VTNALEILDPLKTKDWDGWLVTHQESTIFHSSPWAKVLVESYGYKPLYFTTGVNVNPAVLLPVMEVSSVLTGTRGVSLPFTDSCKVLFPRTSSAMDIRGSVVHYGRRAGWKFIELRDEALFNDQDQFACSFYLHHLDLPVDPQEYFHRLKHGTRTSVNKAKREGVKIVVTESTEAVEGFYRLNCLTRKKHGLPPQPLRFFRKVHEHIISKGLGFVIEARFRDRAVAAAVCFHFGQNAIMKYAAYDYTYQRVRPNNLLVWETVRWYAEHGFKRLSFGRSDMKNEGLRRFKKGWDLTEQLLNYYKFDLKLNRLITNSHPFIERSPQVLSKLPIPVLRLVGGILYKHMG